MPADGQTHSSAAHQTPEIQSQQKTKGVIDYEQDTETNIQINLPFLADPASKADQHNSTESPKYGDDEGTEFWPPFDGYRFKVTDSFLVLFTGVLCLFTGGLWFSTHKLWATGEDQIIVARKAAEAANTSANAALATIDRPYLHIISLNYTALNRQGHPGGNTYITTNINICVKNAGRSPAVVLATRYTMAVRNKFRTDFEYVRDTSSSYHKSPALVLSGASETTTGRLCGTLFIKDTAKNWLHFGYYVIVQIDYLDPISLDKRVRGFLYYMPQGPNSATPIYDPAYDYDRKQTQPSDPNKHPTLTLPTPWPGRDIGSGAYPT